MLLIHLIRRGDQVAIVDGRVEILPASGTPVCPVWLQAHSQTLCQQIAKVTESDLYQYIDYSTGWVKGHSVGFVSLTFVGITSGIGVYLPWNANTKYTRSTAAHKRGDRLPAGKFVPKASGNFIQFWCLTKLEKAKKLSAYAEKMHLLKSLVFSGEPVAHRKGYKFKDKAITLACVSNDRIMTAINNMHAVNSSLNARQDLAKTSLNARQGVAKDGRQEFEGKPDTATVTEGFNCVSPEVRKEVKDKRVTVRDSNVIPINQTTDEWLESYGDG